MADDKENKVRSENIFLQNVKLRIAVISAIVFPTVAIAGAFYKLREDMKDQQAVFSQQLAAVRLDSQKEFVDKDTVKELRNDVKQMQDKMHDGFDELKTLIIKRSR